MDRNIKPSFGVRLTILLLLAAAGPGAASSRWQEAVEPPFYAYTHPGWTPDGLQVFADSNRFPGQLAIVDLATRTIDALPAGGGHADWSAVAGRVVFESQLDGNTDLFLLDPERPASPPLRLTTADGFDQVARWSPDGERVVFSSTRDDNLELYVVGVPDGHERRLTDHPAADSSGSFSPDGGRIVFQSNRSGRYQLYVIGSQGGAAARLTDSSGDDWFPDWGSDGRIYFTTNRDGDNEIASVLADGSGFRFHTQNAANDVLPRLSPNGRSLAYQSDLEGGTDIYVLTLSTGAVERVTTGRHFVNLVRSEGVAEARRLFDRHRRGESPAWLFFRLAMRRYADELLDQARTEEAISVLEMIVDHYPDAEADVALLARLSGR